MEHSIRERLWGGPIEIYAFATLNNVAVQVVQEAAEHYYLNNLDVYPVKGRPSTIRTLLYTAASGNLSGHFDWLDPVANSTLMLSKPQRQLYTQLTQL